MQNSGGFSFIQLLIAISIFAAVGLSLTSISLSVQKGQIRNNSLFQLSVLSRNFAVVAANQQAWTKSLNASVNAQAMRCLRRHEPCTVGGGVNGQPLTNVAFALFDGGNEVVYDGTNDTSGFTMDGTPCDSFSASGNKSCPFRFQLKWSARCTPGSCVDPQVKVEAVLEFHPASVPFPLNPAIYSMPLVYRAAQ